MGSKSVDTAVPSCSKAPRLFQNLVLVVSQTVTAFSCCALGGVGGWLPSSRPLPWRCSLHLKPRLFQAPTVSMFRLPTLLTVVVAFPGPIPAWTQTRLSDPISFHPGWQLWSQVVFENGVCLTWERVPKPGTGTQGNSDPVLLILKLLGFRKALMLKIMALKIDEARRVAFMSARPCRKLSGQLGPF